MCSLERSVAGDCCGRDVVTVSKPSRLGIGDVVNIGGVTHTVAGLSGGRVRLIDAAGAISVASPGELFSTPGTAVPSSPRTAPLPPQGLLDSLPGQAVDQARWWEQHIVEVITGLPPEAGRGVVPRLEYDLTVRTLRQREIAKVGELKAQRAPCAAEHVPAAPAGAMSWGFWGLVDPRVSRWLSAAGRSMSGCCRRSARRWPRRRTGPRGRSPGCSGGWSRSWPASTA